MIEVNIISFDGLNRSGKGTQLSLTQKYLEDKMQNVIIVRGDGSREGIGNPEYYDPISKWWQRWQSNTNKSNKDWDNAYLVLNKEIEDELYNFRQKYNQSFFLMDRSYISRWFVERQRCKNTPFDNVIERTQVFPNKYFVLDAPKEILLSRQSDDNPRKSQFRRQIIEQWYDLWQDTLNRVQERLASNMIRLDASQDKSQINKKILESIELYK